jgi:hypothetical protein
MASDETLSRVRPLHESRGPRACGASRRDKTTRRGTPQTGREESQQARAEAKSQTYEAFRLGPRFSVLVALRFFTHLAGDFGKSQALANDLGSQSVEAVTVSPADPMVESEGLLIQIAEQMERLDTDVRGTKPALQKAPELLNTVSVDVPLQVGLSVIDELVNVLRAKPEVCVSPHR